MVGSHRQISMTSRVPAIFAIPILAVVLGLGACGGSDNATSDSAAPAATSVASAQTGAGVNAAPEGQDAKIILTAGLEIVVDDVSDASIRVATTVEGVGGRVFSQQTSLGESPRSTLVLKVPPAKLSGLLEALGNVGTVIGRTQQSEDVTAQFVDLEGRISAAKASVARMRELLDKTGTVSELAQIEGELTKRQTTLEQLLGQQRVLSSRVDLGTVTVSLVPKDAAPKPIDDSLPGIGEALRKSGGALRTAGYTVVLVIVTLAPWLLVAAIVGFPLMAWRRRRRALRPAEPEVSRQVTQHAPVTPATMPAPSRQIPPSQGLDAPPDDASPPVA